VLRSFIVLFTLINSAFTEMPDTEASPSPLLRR